MSIDNRIKRRAKNMYHQAKMPKTGTFYKINHAMVDITGAEFQLYQRGLSDHYNGIPVGENDIGIVYDGYFIRMTKGNALSPISITSKLSRLDKEVRRKKMNFQTSAESMIEQYENMELI